MDTDTVATLVVSGFTFFGLVFTAFFSFLAARNSREANKAVNHTVVPNALSIYELARQNHATIISISDQLTDHINCEAEQVAGMERQLTDLSKQLTDK